jgi:predicted solute-binding protein
MRIAAWNHPVNESVILALEESFPGAVERLSLMDTLQALLDNRVDVALIPSDQALSSQKEVDILPAVGVSSWSNPWMTLVVGEQLGASTMGIMHAPEGRSAALLAGLVLKEHYNTVVALHEKPALPQGLAEHALVTVPLEDASEGDGAGVIPATDESEGVALDLGMEWSELAGYPFVWSLFVGRKDENHEDAIRQLRDVIALLDQNRVELERKWDMDDVSSDFFLNQVRLAVDDLAIASLTQLCDHLFYYGITDEVLPVQFVTLPKDEEADVRPADGPDSIDG